MIRALATLFALAVSCAGPGVPKQELPDAPIAIMHWSREDARRRNEVLEEIGRAPGATKRGVARVEDLGSLLGSREAESAIDRIARWPGRLALLDPRSGEVTRIGAAAPGARPLSWSDDHRRLMFTSGRVKRRPQLFEYDAQTGDVRALTHGDEAHPKGDYGPNGSLVYLGLRRLGDQIRSRLYVTDARASNPRVLLEGEVVDTPRYAPDRERVLFTRAQPAARNAAREAVPLVVSRSAGQGEAPDERVLGRGKEPEYAPDGTWIVYSAYAKGSWNLARMQSDGTGRTPIGSGTRDEHTPTVSPDGRFVAYIAREGDFDLVFVRRRDGSGERPLLEYGAAAWPVW